MFCYKCGQQMLDSAKFCPNCGFANISAQQQPVAQQPVRPAGAKKSAGMIVLVVLLSIIAFFSFGCSACVTCGIVLGEPDEAVEDITARGNWHYYDGEEYLSVHKADANGDQAVDSDWLSLAVFGEEGADIILRSVEQETNYYLSGILEAELDGETETFIVYFNEYLLTVEHPELGRMTLCRESEEIDRELADEICGEWSNIDAAFVFEESTGVLASDNGEEEFAWTAYGEYLILYFVEDDYTVIYHAELDGGSLTLSRFQDSGVSGTESVVWNTVRFDSAD